MGQIPTSILKQLDGSQRLGWKKLLVNDGGAIWHKVGEGKTRIAYAWFATIAKNYTGATAPIFIVVCRREAFDDWMNEAIKLDLGYITCDYEKFVGKNKSKTPRVLLVSHGMLHKLLDDIADWGSSILAITYDEGYLYKRVSSLHCKAARKLSLHIGAAAILSGSMMTARNPEDIYGQLYAIGCEAVLADTLTRFRSKYMHSLNIGDQWTPKIIRVKRADAMSDISRRIRSVASVYFPKSRRKARHIISDVRPSAEQWKYMGLLRDDYYLEIGGRHLDLKSAPALTIKCQQISDGFLVVKEKKFDGTLTESVFEVRSKKLEKLVSLVVELVSAGERPVVWVAFRRSVSIVLQRLQKEGFKCYALYGGKKFDNRGWQQDGQVAICTEDSGSSFNHFSQCAYGIYYSMSWKWLSLQQSRGRHDRKDSKHSTCYYYYLHTEGSLDRSVYDSAVKSQSEEQNLIDLTQAAQSWLRNPTFSL